MGRSEVIVYTCDRCGKKTEYTLTQEIEGEPKNAWELDTFDGVERSYCKTGCYALYIAVRDQSKAVLDSFLSGA